MKKLRIGALAKIAGILGRNLFKQLETATDSAPPQSPKVRTLVQQAQIVLDNSPQDPKTKNRPQGGFLIYAPKA